MLVICTWNGAHADEPKLQQADLQQAKKVPTGLRLAGGGDSVEGVAKVNSRPAGLRVIFNGNSWFNFVPAGVSDLVKSAGIEGHKQVKVPKPNDLSFFEKGQVDVYAHGVHWWTEPINEAEKLVAPALKANPNFRAYYHAAWLVNDGRHLFPEGRKDDVKFFVSIESAS